MKYFNSSEDLKKQYYAWCKKLIIKTYPGKNIFIYNNIPYGILLFK